MYVVANEGAAVIRLPLDVKLGQGCLQCSHEWIVTSGEAFLNGGCHLCNRGFLWAASCICGKPDFTYVCCSLPALSVRSFFRTHWTVDAGTVAVQWHFEAVGPTSVSAAARG